MSSLKKFFTGFIYAFRGLKTGFGQRNMKFHGLMALIVIIAGLIFQLSKLEWIIVLFLIAAVWAAELINSSLEELANLVRDTNKLDYHATTAVRDLSAAAVLVIALAAAIIGLLIFLPKI